MALFTRQALSRGLALCLSLSALSAWSEPEEAALGQAQGYPRAPHMSQMGQMSYREIGRAHV